MFMMIMSMNLFMTILFLFMNHPMSLGLILMIQTILICLISSSHFVIFMYLISYHNLSYINFIHF